MIVIQLSWPKATFQGKHFLQFGAIRIRADLDRLSTTMFYAISNGTYKRMCVMGQHCHLKSVKGSVSVHKMCIYTSKPESLTFHIGETGPVFIRSLRATMTLMKRDQTTLTLCYASHFNYYNDTCVV